MGVEGTIAMTVDPRMCVASLRYFDLGGPFAEAVQRSVGAVLPRGAITLALAALEPLTLIAWRSPSESLLLSEDPQLIQALSRAVAGLKDGCVIELTGGACVLRAAGTGTAELLARIGGHGSMPPLHGSCATRLADLPVMVIRLDGPDLLLVVDRAYLDHLMEWMRVSIRDL